MSSKVQPYEDNGVIVSKGSISVGDEITLSYSGLLVANGADKVYAHVGFGDAWMDKTFIPMAWEDGTFKATLKVTQSDILNVTFKDSADNWDNNSLQNYSFKVAKKAASEEKSSGKSGVEKITAAKTTGANATSKTTEAKTTASKAPTKAAAKTTTRTAAKTTTDATKSKTTKK